MISFLNTVNIYVTDQDEALRFFRDQLSFVVFDDLIWPNGFRWITVAPHRYCQTKLMLYKTTEQMTEYAYIGRWTGMVFYTEDIEKTYKEYKSKGVQFTQEPTVQPWGGMEAQFADIDGNTYELVQSPPEQA